MLSNVRENVRVWNEINKEKEKEAAKKGQNSKTKTGTEKGKETKKKPREKERERLIGWHTDRQKVAKREKQPTTRDRNRQRHKTETVNNAETEKTE